MQVSQAIISLATQGIQVTQGVQATQVTVLEAQVEMQLLVMQHNL